MLISEARRTRLFEIWTLILGGAYLIMSKVGVYSRQAFNRGITIFSFCKIIMAYYFSEHFDPQNRFTNNIKDPSMKK